MKTHFFDSFAALISPFFIFARSAEGDICKNLAACSKLSVVGCSMVTLNIN